MKIPKHLSVALLSATLAFAPISVSANAIPIPASTAEPIQLPKVDAKDLVKKIAKVGRTNAVAFAVEKLFDGIDWVMDPANNQVILNIPNGNYCSTESKDCVNTLEEAGSKFIAFYNKHHRSEILKESDVKCQFNFTQYETGIDCFWKFPEEAIRDRRFSYFGRVRPDTLSYDQIAQEILNNALLGHPESIKFVQEVAEEKAREEAEAKAKEREKEEEEDKKKKCLPVTEPNIRMVLEPTTELAIQKSVSLAKLKSMVEWIEKGGFSAMKPIHVYENYIIVDGHHRFISMKLCHMEAPRTPWAIGSADKRDAYPIKNILLDK